MTLCDWTASTLDLNLIAHPISCDSIIAYRFDNGLSAKFTLRLLNNGNIEIESNRQLVITPADSICLEIGAEKP